jgi:hypothetical protein
MRTPHRIRGQRNFTPGLPIVPALPAVRLPNIYRLQHARRPPLGRRVRLGQREMRTVAMVSWYVDVAARCGFVRALAARAYHISGGVLEYGAGPRPRAARPNPGCGVLLTRRSHVALAAVDGSRTACHALAPAERTIMHRAQ